MSGTDGDQPRGCGEGRREGKGGVCVRERERREYALVVRCIMGG